METGTAVLRQQHKVERAEEKTRRQIERQARIRQAELDGIKEFNFNRRKKIAVKFVHAAADRAIERLNENDGMGWQVDGKLVRACQHIGPHTSWQCFLHGRRLVAVVEIPGLVRQVTTYGSRYRTMKFYVGADGNIYRDGLNKIYIVDLLDRDWPSEITAVAEKINRICV